MQELDDKKQGIVDSFVAQFGLDVQHITQVLEKHKVCLLAPVLLPPASLLHRPFVTLCPHFPRLLLTHAALQWNEDKAAKQLEAEQEKEEVKRAKAEKEED